MIVTHASPDLDCIVATWLLKRFCGMAAHEIVFKKFGEPLPQSRPCVLAVDIGKGELDHHHREDFVSSATLVLEKFGLQKDPVLSELADITRHIDHGLPDDRAGGILNLTKVIAGLNKLHPDDPMKVMTVVLSCVDAIYEEARHWIAVEKEFNKGIQFCTKWGPGIGIETENRKVRGYCHKKGFVVFAYIDPATGYRGLAGQGGTGIDFTEAYGKVRAVEPEAEWYLHFTKDLLICGSDKALNANVSSLTLGQLVSLVRADD